MLKHFAGLNDPKDFHFDLLLEDIDNCRSWRLKRIPQIDGPRLQIISIQPHNLSWLETTGRKVSGNRGYAFPIRKGFFFGKLSKLEREAFKVNFVGDINGILEISINDCCLRSTSKFVREH